MIPRPVTLFALAFGAGLLAGLAHFPALPLAGMAFAGWILLRGRDLALLPWALMAGLGHGVAARAATARQCAARLPRGPAEVTVRLEDRGEDGLVSAAPVGLGCTGPITMRWPNGGGREEGGAALPAGALARVRGRWIERGPGLGRPDGLLAAHQVQRIGSSVRLSPRARLRATLATHARALYGDRAPLVEALILGRRGGVDRGLRDAFAQSGLVHLLSISGFHVGLLATWFFLLFRVARAGRGWALGGSALAALVYVAFLGWPPPAARAAVLAGLVAWSRLRQRRAQPGPLLAVTGLIVLLVDPWALGELGAWLSGAAIWGVTVATRWSDRALGRSWAVRMLAASVGATLATAPITAAALGTVALGGLLLNFLAIPLAALAVPGVFASLLVDPWLPAAGRALAGGAGLALAGLEAVATLGARIPEASMLVSPGPAAALPWLGILVAARWAIAGGMPRRAAAWRLAAAAAAALWLALALRPLDALGRPASGLTLHLLNVGQGDAAVLRTPAGHWVVVDAGPVRDGGRDDAGRRIVLPFLRRHHAGRLAALVLSHAHADHLGGAGTILRQLVADQVVEPASPVADSLYLAFLDEVAEEGVRYHIGRRGDRWLLDGVGFTVLHPDTTWTGWGEDLNEDSVVLLVEYGRFRALFAGDAGLPVEARLRGTVGPVELLKVGHHGSRGATGAEWLAELRPRAAVISVGANRYGHPAPETLRRLAAAGVAVWRTDQDGPVTVWTDGATVAIRGRDRRERHAMAQR